MLPSRSHLEHSHSHSLCFIESSHSLDAVRHINTHSTPAFHWTEQNWLISACTFTRTCTRTCTCTCPALLPGVHRGLGGSQRVPQGRPHTECLLLSPWGFQAIWGTICDFLFSFQCSSFSLYLHTVSDYFCMFAPQTVQGRLFLLFLLFLGIW